MESDIASGSSLGPDDTMAQGGSTGHLEWLEPSGILALESPHMARFGPRSRIYVLPLMVIGALNISADPVFGRVINSDMALDGVQARTMPWTWLALSGTQVCMSLAAA